MDDLVYPCGCRYQRNADGFAWFPAVHQCTEHAAVTKRAADVAEARVRTQREGDG